MARSSIIQREKKRESLTEKYLTKRLSIKSKLKKEDLSFEEASQLRKQLQKLPLNSLPIRRRKKMFSHWETTWSLSKIFTWKV